MDSVALPALAEVVLVTARSVKRDDRPPLPSEIVSVFVIFGAASLLGAWDQRLGSVFGWGIVVATALNVMPFVASGGPTGVNPTTDQGGTIPARGQY